MDHVSLVDLRSDLEAKSNLQDKGFDLDHGMVVEVNGECFAGADAVNTLAVLSTPSDLFNRLNLVLLSSKHFAAVIYPILRSMRWLTLFVMGRSRLSGEYLGYQNHQTIFSILFALFSIFHFCNYAFEYGIFPPSLDMYGILITAVLLFFRPSSSRILFALMLVSSISAILQAPIASYHTMVRNVVLLGYWASFIYAFATAGRWSSVFANFRLSGCGALLVMYFFGIFHKINTDFLNPETSCAVTLWHLLPPPIRYLDAPFFHYSAIYGTFIVEGALILFFINS